MYTAYKYTDQLTIVDENLGLVLAQYSFSHLARLANSLSEPTSAFIAGLISMILTKFSIKEEEIVFI